MKILVHLHLFYTEMLAEMFDYLRNLEHTDYDLYVTVAEDNQELTNRILAFKKDARIIVVPNRGYDVAPFIEVLKKVDLDQYDYVIKLHTKQTLRHRAYLPGCSFVGDEWRKCLVSFMDTPQHFKASCRQLEKNSKVGLVSHFKLIIRAKKEDREANATAEEILQQLGLQTNQRLFVAGTMFMCRAGLLKPLQQAPWGIDDFEPYDPFKPGGSLAHAYERLFGYVITAQGYTLSSWETKTWKDQLHTAALQIEQFLFYKRVNRKGKMHVKICKIPVFSKQVK